MCPHIWQIRNISIICCCHPVLVKIVIIFIALKYHSSTNLYFLIYQLPDFTWHYPINCWVITWHEQNEMLKLAPNSLLIRVLEDNTYNWWFCAAKDIHQDLITYNDTWQHCALSMPFSDCGEPSGLVSLQISKEKKMFIFLFKSHSTLIFNSLSIHISS